jgi:hypothetical protein
MIVLVVSKKINKSNSFTSIFIYFEFWKHGFP